MLTGTPPAVSVARYGTALAEINLLFFNHVGPK